MVSQGPKSKTTVLAQSPLWDQAITRKCRVSRKCNPRNRRSAPIAPDTEEEESDNLNGKLEWEEAASHTPCVVELNQNDYTHSPKPFSDSDPSVCMRVRKRYQTRCIHHAFLYASFESCFELSCTCPVRRLILRIYIVTYGMNIVIRDGRWHSAPLDTCTVRLDSDKTLDKTTQR